MSDDEAMYNLERSYVSIFRREQRIWEKSI